MPRHTTLKTLIRNFRTLGFDGPYSGGRHSFMVREGHKVRIPNPHGKGVSAGLLTEILRQAKISAEEWSELESK